MEKIQYHPEFLTATILNWTPILKHEDYKDIVVNSLQYLVANRQIFLYSYCIMDNHIHLIWQMRGDHRKVEVRRSFFRFTAQKIIIKLQNENSKLLNHFRSTQADRKYHIWERRPLGVELFSEKVLLQKLHYIHQNPVKAKFVNNQEDYRYSSARYYLDGIDSFGMLSHYNG